MERITFKNNDKLDIVGLGTWKSDPGEVAKAVYEAIKIGYRHIDCAAIYGNENEVGEGIKRAIEEGVVSREELWITSKLWNDSHRKEDVLPALQNTLEDLQLDYLDLYLIHWPVALKKGVQFPKNKDDVYGLDEVPLTETWSGMEYVKEQKLTKHIGVSNFNIDKLKLILEHCNHKPEMLQVEMHPFLPQNELVNFAKSNEIHLTAYSPLGSGDRPEKMKQDDEPILLEQEVIKTIADKHKCTTAQVLISWAVNRNTAVIPKSVHKDRLIQNFESASIQLTTQDMKEIADIDYQFRFVNADMWKVEDSYYEDKKFWD